MNSTLLHCLFEFRFLFPIVIYRIVISNLRRRFELLLLPTFNKEGGKL